MSTLADLVVDTVNDLDWLIRHARSYPPSSLDSDTLEAIELVSIRTARLRSVLADLTAEVHYALSATCTPIQHTPGLTDSRRPPDGRPLPPREVPPRKPAPPPARPHSGSA